MADPDFIVNVVLRPDGKLVRVVAGHYDLAHREGCRTVDRMMRVSIDAPYDLVVASAGGFPLDIDLRQAHKGLENACQALRPGGSILFYAECPDGAGIRSFEDYVRRYRDDFEMREALSREFVVGGHKAYWVARLGRLYNVHLVSGLDPEFVRRCHFNPVSPADHEAALRDLLRQAGPDARVAVVPYSGFTLPAVKVPQEVRMTTSTAVPQSYRNYVGGEWVDSAEHEVVRLPYDGTPVGAVPRAGVELVEAAVEAARGGFRAMRELANYERADLLLRVADLVRRDLAEYGQIVCAETGKPIKEARVEAARSIANSDRRRPRGAAASRRSRSHGIFGYRQRPHGHHGTGTASA